MSLSGLMNTVWQGVNMNKLSERVRPNSESAPWVVEEIKRLERQINSLQHWIDHYKSAIPKGENKIIEQNKIMKEALELIKKRNSEFEKYNNTWQIANEALKTIERLNKET